MGSGVCAEEETPHQIQSAQHDVERVHLWFNQLLPVHLHLDTVTEELQQHLRKWTYKQHGSLLQY